MIGFLKAKPEVLTEIYHIQPTRILADGDGIAHMETNPIFMTTKDDPRVQYWSSEAIVAYIDLVIGE